MRSSRHPHPFKSFCFFLAFFVFVLAVLSHLFMPVQKKKKKTQNCLNFLFSEFALADKPKITVLRLMIWIWMFWILSLNQLKNSTDVLLESCKRRTFCCVEGFFCAHSLQMGTGRHTTWIYHLCAHGCVSYTCTSTSVNFLTALFCKSEMSSAAHRCPVQNWKVVSVSQWP